MWFLLVVYHKNHDRSKRVIKVIEFNVDRVRAAMRMIEKVFMESYDITVLQDQAQAHGRL